PEVGANRAIRTGADGELALQLVGLSGDQDFTRMKSDQLNRFTADAHLRLAAASSKIVTADLEQWPLSALRRRFCGDAGHHRKRSALECRPQAHRRNRRHLFDRGFVASAV